MLQSSPPPIPPEDFAILARNAASPQALADLVALYRRLQPDPTLAYQVLEAVPLNVVLCDRNSRIVMVSPAIGDMIGIPVQDLLGRTFDEIALIDFDTPGGGRVRVQFAEALNGKPTVGQFEQLWEPLPPVTVEYTLTPVTAADGQVSHVLFTIRDVTDAMSGQQAAREISAARAIADRYRTLVQSLPVSSVVMFDHEFRYLLAEGGSLLSPEKANGNEFLDKTLYDIVPEELRDEIVDIYRRTLAGEEITRVVERGDYIFRMRYVPVRDDHGAVIAGMVVNEDITAERRSEEALRLSERRFRALAASIPASTVLVFDHDLRYVIVEGHDVFVRHGYDADAMRGRTLREVIRPEIYEAVSRLYRATLAGEEIRTEFTRDGHIYETHFFPVFDDHGAVTYGTALTEDVTHARKAQEALRQSERRFRALAASIPDSAVLIFDRDLRYVIVEGHDLLERVGQQPDTMVGKTVYDLTPDESRRAYNEMLFQAALEGRELKVEAERNGRTLLGRFFPIRDDDGQVMYGALLMEDITDARQKEAALRESQARFERAFDISPLGMALVNLDGRFVETNASYQRMLGYSADEMRQRTTADVTHPDDRNLRSARELLADSAAEHFQIDKRYVHKDGRTVWGRLHVTLLRADDGTPQYFLSQIEDITERKRMEAELREAKQRFEQAFDSSSLGMAMTSLDLTFITTNRSLNHMLGYEPGGLDGMAVADVSDPDDMQQNIAEVQRLYRGEIEHARMEKRYIHKDGHVVWGALHVSVVRDEQGRALYQVSQIEDITERKRMEAELRDAQARFKLGFDASPIGMALVGRDMRYLEVNPALCRIFGYSAEELRTISGYDLTHPDDRAVTKEFRKKFEADPGASYQQEKRYIHKDGHIIWATLTPAAIRDENGEVLYYLVQIEDISERKRAEAQLREAQERFTHAFEGSPLGMALATEDFRILSVNPALARMLGYTVEEALTLDSPDFSHPDDLTLDNDYRRRLLAGEIDRYQYEKRYIHKGGHTVWGSVSVGLVRSDDGQPLYTVVQIEDISERKRIEAELRESRERFTRAFTDSPIGIALVATDLRFLEANESMSRMFGYSVDEFKTLTVQDITAPDDVAGIEDRSERLLKGEMEHIRYEKRYRHRDGRILWGALSVGVIRDADGNPLYSVSQIEDITERKRIEAELRESQARFKHAFEESPLGMSLATEDYRILSVNPALARMLGYSVEELLALRVPEITHPDDLTLDAPYRRRLFAGEIERYQYEKRYIHKDGHTVWGSVSVGLVRSDDGQPQYTVVQIEDITERKRAEAALRESQARFQSAFANSPVGMVLVTPDGRFFESNTSFQQMLGYSAAEIHGLDVDRITFPDDLAADHALMHSLLAGETDHYRYEKRYFRKDGAIIWIVLTAALIRDEQGAPLYFVSQVEDITERKRSEAALRESQARFQRAFENSPIGMALVAPDLHVMSVNHAFEQMVGYSRAELTGLHVHAFTHPDDIPPDDAEKQRLFAGDIDHYQIEKRYVHKDGRIIWTTLTESVIRDEQGTPLYLVAQIEDITERKRMITELRDARQRYENLVSSLPGMVFQLRQSADGWQRFDYINPRIYDLVGLTAEEIMADARVLFALVDEGYRESLFAAQDESRENLTPFIWEGLYHLPSGETAYYHIESQSVREPDGSTVWTGIGVDVTAQRYLQTALLEQEKLRVSLAKEREVSDLKSNMMVHISHEFRTPLAIIQSSSELLDRYGERMTVDKRREHITRVYEEVHHLASILDELSILAHGDGWGKANLMRVSLPEVCTRVMERVQRGTHLSHRIEVQTAARLPDLVNVDPRLVETMLAKLVQNASKFSEPGTRITIELDATAHEVLINVRDEGIGIPEDEMRRLFEPFFKGSNNDLPTGMGLGLSIVRDAVLLHGGTIHAQSAVGQGTVFMIRLPQQMA